MTSANTSRRRPDTAAIVAGLIGVIALGVWIVSLLTPLPDDELAPRAPEKTPTTPATKPPISPRVSTEPAAGTREPPRAAPATATPPVPQPAVEKTAPRKPAEPARTAVQAKAEDAMPKAPPKPAVKAAPDPMFDILPGRWVGTYVNGNDSVGLTLNIASVSSASASATAVVGGQSCRGTYAMVGNYNAGKLHLHAPQHGGPAGDCPLSFTLALDDNGRLSGAGPGGERIRLKR